MSTKFPFVECNLEQYNFLILGSNQSYRTVFPPIFSHLFYTSAIVLLDLSLLPNNQLLSKKPGISRPMCQLLGIVRNNICMFLQGKRKNDFETLFWMSVSGVRLGNSEDPWCKGPVGLSPVGSRFALRRVYRSGINGVLNRSRIFDERTPLQT